MKEIAIPERGRESGGTGFGRGDLRRHALGQEGKV